MPPSRWREEEDRILLRCYRDLTMKQLQQLLPRRSLNAIKTRIRLLRKKGFPLPTKLPKVDLEEFKKLWLEGVSGPEIAERFNVALNTVYVIRRKLNLPKRKGRLKDELLSLFRREGVVLLKEANRISARVARELVMQRVLFKVTFAKRAGQGRTKLIKEAEFIKEEYIGKSFLCYGRTAVVRLMMKALKPPKDSGVRRAMTHFLKKYLTEAERVAVMLHLGVKKWPMESVNGDLYIAEEAK